MATLVNAEVGICLTLTRAISRARTVDEIYSAALDALGSGLAVSRSSILLFDSDGVMRFKAFRGLSAGYRKAVEGHTPWRPDSPDPEPIVVADVGREPSLAAYLPTIAAEGIAAMAFIPLVSMGRVIGKFMLYYDTARGLSDSELQLAGLIAAQVAFAVERTWAEESARRSEHRLRFALDAARMGTWDWDLAADKVEWSDNLERVHGLEPGTFDGTFASYEREIHPEDRERVLASARRAIEQGVQHDVEYRIVAPDGTIRWVEGKGRVEYDGVGPVRMTGVCMDVTRRKEAEIARLAAAEEASRLKDEFLATLSHELRTPLNAILGWSQMLQSADLPPERARQAIEIIGRNAKLQAHLIEDILDVSRIITGKLEMERRPLALPPLLEAVANGAIPAAAAKGIQVRKDVPADLPAIEADPKRLQQVLGNVLSNAIKFTPEGGQIEIRCGTDGDMVSIAVRDSGVGIAPQFLPFVFDRFRQADSRSTRAYGGLGLGLAIARHLVEEHGGEIRAHSDGPGRGTTIAIRLPAAASQRPAAEVPFAVVGDQPTRLDGARVLVVDDQRDSREMLAALLERCGAEVILCDRAATALEALDTMAISLLVADIAMPDVDGYALIEQVRRARSAIPAVAVSAYGRREDRSLALAAGYDAYCAKPVEAYEFLQTVRRVRQAAP
jgi:PAS domain S-box-containing protein